MSEAKTTTMYLARSWWLSKPIVEVQVEKLSADSYWTDGRRRSRITGREVLFTSLDSAYEWLMEVCRARVASSERQLEDAKKELADMEERQRQALSALPEKQS